MFLKSKRAFKRSMGIYEEDSAKAKGRMVALLHRVQALI
jgi:hypothetical protein